MRYPEAHAGRSGSVPLMLRGPKPVRVAISTAVAGLIGLVPVVMVSSPANAIDPPPPDYQLSASSTPVLETATPQTKVVDGKTVPDKPKQKTVTITARLTAAAPSGGATIPIVAGGEDDTAVSGDPEADPEGLRDYAQLADDAAITIAAGKTSGTATVTLYDDELDEADTQFFTVMKDPGRALTGLTKAVAGADTAKVTIQDDDATPTVSIEGADATTEGNSLLFPLNLSGPSERDVTVKVTTANGVTSGDNYGATAPSDYVPRSGETVIIPKTSTSALAIVTTKEDEAVEASPEMLSLSIANPSYATLGTPTTATGGINDAGPAPELKVYTNKDDDTQTHFTDEGNSGETAGFVYLKLSSKSTIPVRLDYKFGADGDKAKNGVDYKGTDGSLTIAPGDDTAKIPVSVVGDKVYEPENGGEEVSVVFTSPNGSVDSGSLGDEHPAVLTIDDDDDAPTYSISNFGIAEGNTGVTTAKVPVTLSGPVNEDVMLDVVAAPAATGDAAKEDGSNDGTTVGDNDYDDPDSTVTIAAGDTVGYVEVPINADVIFEHDEGVDLTLTQTGQPISDDAGSGVSHKALLTIRNDDDAPTIKFNETSGSEGTSLRVTGQVVGQSQYNIPIDFSYGNTGDAAAEDTDYSFDSTPLASYTITRGDAPGPMSWTVGMVQTSGPMASVYLSPDNIDEPTEALTVVAKEHSPGTVGFKQAVATYKINDDPGDLPPSAAVGDATVMGNGGTVNVPVNLAFTSDATSTTQTVTIPYWTVDGTAKAGSDYTAKQGVLTYAPGELTKNVIVPITDKSRSSDRKFYVKLGTAGPAGASVTDSSGDVTIQASEGGGTGGTSTTIAAPARVTGGTVVPIMGTAEPNATVELWGAPMGDDSELKKITSVKSDSTGHYSFTRWIGSGYRFQTRCNSVESAEKKVQVEQDPAFVVGAPSRGSVNLTVQSDPKDPGQPVIIQRLDRGKWVNTNWRGTTNSNGQWKGSVKPGRGSWQLRAFVAGYTPDGLLPGYSDGKKVTIK